MKILGLLLIIQNIILRDVSYTYKHDVQMYRYDYIYVLRLGQIVNIKLKALLTLRGLSLFFKILPISNTGVSAAYILAIVHFLYPKLGSFSNMEYYFYQLAYWDSKVPKRFVGLNQIQCSPSFDWNWGKQNDPTACWDQLHP